MTSEQAILLLASLDTLTEWVKLVGFFGCGVGLALVWSTTWRG